MPKDREKSRDEFDENEPKSETIPGRDFAGTSFAANEREQTADLRRRSPQADANVADGGVSEELESDTDRRPD